MTSSKRKSIVIIGAGPAGLMAAEVLSNNNVTVHIFDAMPSVGRKLLMAGKSGLNMTHSEPYEHFVGKYGTRQNWIEPLLKEFGPKELVEWVKGLGIETFVGTSGRVFPVGMKASPLLRAWLKRLEIQGVSFHLRHKWIGWDENRQLRFETPDGEKLIPADAVILAVGGGSWSRLGSDGAWATFLEHAGVKIEALKPSNCGFDVGWYDHFREKYHGHPVKSVVISFGEIKRQGEFVITKHGMEGSLIYAFSAMWRDEIEKNGKVIFQLDLSPNLSREDILLKISRPRGSRSTASHIEKTTGIKGAKAGLLREFVSKADFVDMEKLASAIKALPIPLVATRPLDEAISSAGGVLFEELDESLMLKNLRGVFCAGEMLDWEAPTGGYLLTACFASGRAAGLGALHWLKHLD